MSRARRTVKALMIMAAAFLALIALARPQWGFEWEEIKRSGLDMLIAVDVSKSMLARDVKPNRLERSKFAVKDLVKKLNGDRIGLIAFAGTAFLQCPLTIDYNGFLLALDDLSTSTIPRGGTSISSAIREACSILSGAEKKYKALVIITDGEDLEGDPVKAAQEALRLGVKVYCVGVGTTDGDLIPIIDETGQRSYIMDSAGTAVKSRLNEKQLKEIALISGGAYVRATQGEFGLTLLYDRIISKLEKREIDSKMRKHYEERYQVFLAIAIIILFIEPIISERKRVTE
jgi:Ca-activated chloride channel family protein